ncbi:ribosome hibernation-promoting factor, HPF/YfiA family [Hyphobacterium sp.]|jgi:ribosomal subunit interface protein|uniref:ribosome hibernation-promoting factor, HPF/YfiA family n=1 Tax=Hyphobacterium sp. TaxID=2004662 RepID=UPI003BA8B191
MQIQVVSKGIDVSEALREEIVGRVEEAVSKYFNRPSEAYIAVSREGGGFRVTVSLHLPSGVMLQAQGDDGDAYKAADKASEHLEKRLRRYKRKLKNHHNENKAELPAETTPITVFRGRPDDDFDDEDMDAPGGDEPVIVAETPGELRAMTAGMAVLELEAAGAPFLMFRNIAHNGVNIVYRRPDGHVGWIDPDRDKSG